MKIIKIIIKNSNSFIIMFKHNLKAIATKNRKTNPKDFQSKIFFNQTTTSSADQFFNQTHYNFKFGHSPSIYNDFYLLFFLFLFFLFSIQSKTYFKYFKCPMNDISNISNILSPFSVENQHVVSDLVHKKGTP